MISLLPILLALPVAAPQGQEAPQAAPELRQEIPAWISFYGDLRLRYEATLDQPNGEDRHRGRMRFRVGAKMDIADNLTGEVRLSTTSGDANNPHWDFGGDLNGDTQNGADAVLDRINVTWDACESAHLKAGKMGNPFAVNPVYGEWIWDGDIQPAGVAAIWSGDERVDVRLGHFILDEENGAGNSSDPALTVLQINANTEQGNLHWDLNTALWNWTNEGPAEAQVWDTIVAARAGAWKASLEYLQNLDDETGEDTGFAVGLQHNVGRADKVFASYFDFDANASLWGFGQDDVPIAPGAMGLSGFIAGYQHQVADNTSLKFWALQGDDEVDDPLRIRAELNVSF